MRPRGALQAALNQVCKAGSLLAFHLVPSFSYVLTTELGQSDLVMAVNLQISDGRPWGSGVFKTLAIAGYAVLH